MEQNTETSKGDEQRATDQYPTPSDSKEDEQV